MLNIQFHTKVLYTIDRGGTIYMLIYQRNNFPCKQNHTIKIVFTPELKPWELIRSTKVKSEFSIARAEFPTNSFRK